MKIEGLLTASAILAELGGRLAQRRLALELTQEMLAEQAGVSKRDGGAYRGRGYGTGVDVYSGFAGIGTAGSAGNTGASSRAASDGPDQAEGQGAEAGQWQAEARDKGPWQWGDET